MNQQEILQNMIDDFIACDTGVEYLGRGGVVYGILQSISYPISALYYNYDKLQRSRYLATASGDELDTIGEERGIDRQSANAAGAVISFIGTDGTNIPNETRLQASNGTIFITQAELEIGSDIEGLAGDEGASYALTSKVYAVAETTGSNGNVPAKTITRFEGSDIAGVDSLTNYLPAENGQDAEPDNHYRARIARTASILNVKTSDFFYAKAREYNTKILRVLPIRQSIRVVRLWVLTKDGAGLSAAELTNLANHIETYTDPVLTIETANVVFSPITIKIKIDLTSGYTLDTVYSNMANALVKFIDWSNWAFGKNVDDSDLLTACNVDGVENIYIDEFYTHIDGAGDDAPGDIEVGAYSVPRVVHLEITVAGPAGLSRSSDLTDTYEFEGAVT